MHVLSTLLAFVASAAILVTAIPSTPSAEAALSTRTCIPSTTFTANFDTLPTGVPVPSSYGPKNAYEPGNLEFDMTVANASSYFIHPSSGNNSALLPLFGASISGYFALESFSFACSEVVVYEYPSLPVACSIQLISVPFPHPQNGLVAQTFKYTPSAAARQGQELGKMRKVVVKKEFQGVGQLYWYVVAGGGTTQILVDDVVLVSYGDCPE